MAGKLDCVCDVSFLGECGRHPLAREKPRISARYWSYVLVHLLDDGYIEGAEKIKVMGAPWAHIKMLDDLAITPKGIGYLMDNSLMEKIKKEAVAVVSAIATRYIG